MTKFKAFLDGMREFRSYYTIHYTSYNYRKAYDAGREFMHRITFYKFERFGK